jgi:hypothetical protein
MYNRETPQLIITFHKSGKISASESRKYCLETSPENNQEKFPPEICTRNEQIYSGKIPGQAT